MQRREVKHVAVSHVTSFSTEFKRIQSFKELLAKQATFKEGITYFMISLIITELRLLGSIQFYNSLNFCNSIRNSWTNGIK